MVVFLSFFSFLSPFLLSPFPPSCLSRLWPPCKRPAGKSKTGSVDLYLSCATEPLNLDPDREPHVPSLKMGAWIHLRGPFQH